MDVRETKEVLKAMNEITLFLIEALKDGVDFSDFVDFYNKVTKDQKFSILLRDAYDGMGEIPEELSDLDMREGLELIQLQLDYIPKIVDSFRKK